MTEGTAPIWVRVLRVHREKGLAGVWFGALARAGYRRLAVLERRFDEPLVAFRPRVEAEIRQLRRDDEGAVTALDQTPGNVFRERLDRGHQCWGAWCGGALRHVEWLAFADACVEYLGIRLLLDADAVYVYRAFTDVSFRGMGFTPATQTACLPTLRRQGFRLAICAVLPENPWAFSPWLKVGYRRIGVLASLAVGSRRRARLRLDGGGRAADGWRLEGSEIGR